MLAFFQTVFTFYHQGFELAKDFDHYKRALQINIQNVRNIKDVCYYICNLDKNDSNHDNHCLYTICVFLFYRKNKEKVLVLSSSVK